MKVLPWLLSLLIMLALTVKVRPAEITDADIARLSPAEIAATLEHLLRNAEAAQKRATAAEEAAGRVIGELQTVTRAKADGDAALLRIEKTAAKVEKERDDAAELAASNARKAAEQKERADAEAAESSRRGNLLGWGAGIVSVLAVHALLSLFAPLLSSLGTAYPPWKPAILAARFVLPALAAPIGYGAVRLWLGLT